MAFDQIENFAKALGNFCSAQQYDKNINVIIYPSIYWHIPHLLVALWSQGAQCQRSPGAHPTHGIWSNLKCPSLKYTQLITMKFRTCHDSVTVVTCAKFRCDK